MKPTVQLMLTCLCDSYFGEVGIATVQVLEKLGCAVLFPAEQTCCGQPPFNSGDWATSANVANHCLAVFEKDPSPVVIPSASCTAMVREGYHKLLPNRQVPQVFELSEFITEVLQVHTFANAKPYPKRVVFHQACHGRSIGLKTSQLDLLETVPGIEIISTEQPEQCCGFGGAFCVTHGTLSAGIGLEKLKTFADTGVQEVVTGDMGCALHLKGLSEKNGFNFRFVHFAQILAEVLA